MTREMAATGAAVVVVTDYHSNNHIPYVKLFREESGDHTIDIAERLRICCDAIGAVDGDEIEIVVRKTGRRPFGDRKVVLVEPHTYRREEST